MFAAEQGKTLMHAGAAGQGSHYLLFDYCTAAAAFAVLDRSAQARARRPLLEMILAAHNEDGSFVIEGVVARDAEDAREVLLSLQPFVQDPYTATVVE